MSNNQRVKVTIENAKRIPGVGKGPIRNPIYITKEQYDLLKRLGYTVIKHDDTLKKISKPNRVKEKEVINKEDRSLDNTNKIDTNNCKEREITKKEIKEYLNSKNIPYNDKANLTELKKIYNDAITNKINIEEDNKESTT